ncbi:MAG: peptidoglycan DD-metalloendopeptidase family protein [Nannocystaceae bacterium]
MSACDREPPRPAEADVGAAEVEVDVSAAARGCGAPQALPDPPTPRVAYVAELRGDALYLPAAAEAWVEAGERALATTLRSPAPLRETIEVTQGGDEVLALRLDARRGQRLEIAVRPEEGAAGPVFIDLYTLDEARFGDRRRAASGDAERPVIHEVEGEALVLRVQPGLATAGRFTVTVDVAPSLPFPVVGKDGRAIQSRFGAPRSGGRRRHHGVDIFAARGTATVAVIDGVVRQGRGRRGGNFIWVEDETRGIRLYYAHLSQVFVHTGQRVRAGEIIGRVGTTGNAATTAPHLHFGVYARRPVDPAPFLEASRPAPAPDRLADLGTWMRAGRRVTVRGAPSRDAAALATIDRGGAARVLGARRGFVRVALADGTEGFVRAAELTSTRRRLSRLRLRDAASLHFGPSLAGAAVETIDAGTRVELLARAEGAALVRVPSGATGWIAEG